MLALRAATHSHLCDAQRELDPGRPVCGERRSVSYLFSLVLLSPDERNHRVVFFPASKATTDSPFDSQAISPFAFCILPESAAGCPYVLIVR